MFFQIIFGGLFDLTKKTRNEQMAEFGSQMWKELQSILYPR